MGIKPTFLLCIALCVTFVSGIVCAEETIGKIVLTPPAESDSPVLPVTPSFDAALNAIPTASTVMVNGEKIAFEAYNVQGSNYFKLRDLAYILTGTEKQFAIGWDSVNSSISLTSDSPYVAVGSEMAAASTVTKAALPTSSMIYLDGEEIQFIAYNIEGSNYFKLRDIGVTFDFSVVWDEELNTIIIDTSTGLGTDGLSASELHFPATTITFPANLNNIESLAIKTVYQIEPFDISLELPEGWQIVDRIADPTSPRLFFFCQLLFSPLSILDTDDNLVGMIGYNIYEPYEGAEDNPQAIYSWIALGNNYQFDVRTSYEVTEVSDWGKTAIVGVYHSPSVNQGTELYNYGIISYHDGLKVYIAAEILQEMATPEQVATLAKSIVIH